MQFKKLLSVAQIRAWDEFTIKNEPVSSIDLMERAGKKAFDWIKASFSSKTFFIVFCGSGNNGGDGLVIARMLLRAGFAIKVFYVASGKFSADFEQNFQRLKVIHSPACIEERNIPVIPADAIVIDCLFGSGLNRPASGLYEKIIGQINASANTVISIDIPSGMQADAFDFSSTVVKADFTLTFQLPKLSFLLPASGALTGRVVILEINLKKEFLHSIHSDMFLIEAESIASIIKKRLKFSHKGSFGRALIVAGSKGTVGAAILCAKACGRSGAGVVTGFIPLCGYEIFQSAFPEALCITDEEDYIENIPDVKMYTSIGVGPGLAERKETAQLLSGLFKAFQKPLVLDASALNVISENKALLKEIPKESILTPHVKEFERLAGPANNDFDRLEKQKELATDLGVFVVLKGAYTVIATPEGKLFFNTTGNPGMATGGSGDVLTGIITGLLSQGYSSLEASVMGVYMHGFAGDQAARKKGQASLLASDIIEGISDFYLNFAS